MAAQEQNETFSRPDLAAQRDVREDIGVCVDPIQSVHHGLYPLDPVLLPHRAALSLVDLSEMRQQSVRLTFIHTNTRGENDPTCISTGRARTVPCRQVAGGGQRTELL